MRKALILMRPRVDYPSDSALARCADPLRKFAAGFGHDDAKVTALSAGSPAVFWREAGHFGILELQNDPSIETLSSGDSVFVRALDSLADDPLALIQGLRKLISVGANIYVLSLGNAVTYLPAISEVCDLVHDMQARLDEAELELARSRDEANREAFHVMKEAFGQHIRAGRIPWAHIAEPAAEGDKQTADAIHRARKAKNWTQARLANEAGVTQSQVSVAERDGAHLPKPAMQKILRTLGYRGDVDDDEARLKWAVGVCRNLTPDGWEAGSSLVLVRDGQEVKEL